MLPGVHRVVVAAGEQRRARGRRDGRGVELGVAQPVLGQLVQGRRVARPAEGARRAVTDVVEQDDDDIGRPLGRLDRLRKIRLRILHGEPDLPLERGGRGRKNILCGSAGDQRSPRQRRAHDGAEANGTAYSTSFLHRLFSFLLS